MWLSFFFITIISFCITLVPGLAISRALGAGWLVALYSGAPISCALYSLLGILLYRLGYPTAQSLLTATAVVVIASAAIIILLKIISIKRVALEPSALPRFSIPTTILYLASTTFVLGVFFLLPLGEPSNVNQIGDNSYHITRIADMASKGNFSALDASFYIGIVPERQVFDTSAGFYPEGFHIVAALTQILTGTSTAVAENATIFTFSALLYALGISGLMQILFGANSRPALLGALLTCACVMFPFRLLTVNGFYPFVSGLACVPSCITLFLLCFGKKPLRPRLRFLFLLLPSLIGLAFLHPGACLAAGAMLVPYIILQLVPQLSEPWSSKRLHPRRCVAFVQVISAMLLAIAWMLVYMAPVMSSVVSYSWDWHVSPIQALYLVFSLGLRLELPSWPLAFLVFVGLIRSFSSKRTAWVGTTYLFMAFIFVVDASATGGLRHLIAGFWYTDPERISAFVALWSIPLAAIGLDSLCAIASRMISGKTDPSRYNYLLSASLLVSAFFVLNFLPNHQVYGGHAFTPFGVTRAQLARVANGGDALNYTPQEESFVEKALQAIPEGSTVANIPYDGSVFAHPFNDLNTLYRANTSVPSSTESEESQKIRKQLKDIHSDETVREAADTLGLRYVLILGTEEYALSSDGILSSTYNAFCVDDWKGLLDITDDTPGFEVVLADGDMRLYKIIGTDETSASTE